MGGLRLKEAVDMSADVAFLTLRPLRAERLRRPSVCATGGKGGFRPSERGADLASALRSWKRLSLS